jgi:hypothetical protein
MQMANYGKDRLNREKGIYERGCELSLWESRDRRARRG